MAETVECFTFIWKIKNFSFMVNGTVSPAFIVEPMGKSKWTLELSTIPHIFCCLNLEYTDYNIIKHVIDYELSYLSSDGSVLFSELYFNETYANDTLGNGSVNMKKNQMCRLKKDLLITEDTLTVRCRMWDKFKQITQSGRCFAETQIGIEYETVIGTVEKFSNTETNSTNLVCIKSPSTLTFFSSLKLFVATDGKLSIQMKPLDNIFTICRCEIFIRDLFGNKILSGQGKFFDTKLQCINLTLPKEHLIKNKRMYLRKDVLTLTFEVSFSTGKDIEKMDDPEYGFDDKDMEGILSNNKKPNLNSQEQHLKNYTVLKDDLISLFREGVLCDTKLKTTTETFPAHAVVLSARSSVFKSMFITDMKEKANKCVDINDLDADTVRRMLSFMYLDTLDDLEWESANNLYYAADKYNIAPLKQRCSDFLEQNLLMSNCCDVLLLSDKHQDMNLKRATQDYIAKNFKVVLICEKWKNLEKTHPQLALEVFNFVFGKTNGLFTD